MQVDEPGAVAMFVPDNITFNWTDATWCVIHKTAGFQSAQEVAAYFQAGSDGREVSSHYVVGQDGVIVQCVPESRGSGANCCTTGNYAPYLPYCNGQADNMNLHSISIEHVDPSQDNSTPLTPAQKAASFRLVRHICERHNIPMRGGDQAGGVIGHRDIDPVNKPLCPGNYPWAELWSYLKGGNTPVPTINLNPTPSPGQIKQADDIWNSTAALLGGKAPDPLSGIAHGWRIIFYNGYDLGPAITYEFGTVDWDGNPIRRINFTGGWIEYYTQAAKSHTAGEWHAYTVDKKII